MSNPLDPFDEISREEIFQELRAFASTPIPEDPQVLASLIDEFKSTQIRPARKWFKRLVVPTVTIVIAVPSLAYAGLLPETVSTPIKEIVHSVTIVVTKPIIAISNSITGTSNEPRLNTTPSTNPSPNGSAIPTVPGAGTESESVDGSTFNEEDSQSGSGDQGEEQQANVALSSPTKAPTSAHSTTPARLPSGLPSPTKKSQEHSEEHSEEHKNPSGISSPSASGVEVEHAQKTETDTETDHVSATGSAAVAIPSPSSSQREREGEKGRVRSSAKPSPIASPTPFQGEDD